MCKLDNPHNLCYVISPEAGADHNSHTVRDNLMVFGRDEEEDQ